MTEPVRTPKGAQTKDSLLRAARTLFINEGYAATSMRKVAQMCGVSLGHLQYFFPTKNSLLTEMLQEAAEEYAAHYASLAKPSELGPKEKLLLMVQYLLEDSRSSHSTFFMELWSVTLRDREAHAVLHKLFGENRKLIQRFVSEARTDLSPKRVEMISLQIIALADGMIVYTHSAEPNEVEFADAVRSSLAVVGRIIDSE